MSSEGKRTIVLLVVLVVALGVLVFLLPQRTTIPEEEVIAKVMDHFG